MDDSAGDRLSRIALVPKNKKKPKRYSCKRKEIVGFLSFLYCNECAVIGINTGSSQRFHFKMPFVSSRSKSRELESITQSSFGSFLPSKMFGSPPSEIRDDFISSDKLCQNTEEFS